MPHRKPLLAIQEVFQRYVMPELSSIFVSNSPAAGVPVSESQRFMENMQRFEQIVALVRAKNIPLFVVVYLRSSGFTARTESAEV